MDRWSVGRWLFGWWSVVWWLVDLIKRVTKIAEVAQKKGATTDPW